MDTIKYIKNLKKRLKNTPPSPCFENFLLDILRQCYIDTTNNIPNTIYVKELLDENNIVEGDGLGLFASTVAAFMGSSFSSATGLLGRVALENADIDYPKSISNIKEHVSGVIEIKLSKIHSILVAKDFVFYDTYFLYTNKECVDELKQYIVIREKTETPKVYLVLHDGSRFAKHPMDLNVKDKEGNYNDDLPNEKINNLIRGTDSALILLHGEPGTGKSSYIRNLINENKKIQFLYMDASLFGRMNDSSFIQFLVDNRDSVLILEDCESLLASRDTNYNNLISSLLNLSDGLLGDALNLKFICTFNTDDTNIDSALLRKGRLKCKYKFEKLSEDKVEAIFSKQGIDAEAKPMTLAEVYNFLEENGGEGKRKRIGFS